MAQSAVWPTTRFGNYGQPEPIAGKAYTGVVSGLAPWLHQSTGGSTSRAAPMSGSAPMASGSAPWYQGVMNAQNNATYARIQAQRDAIAAQKAQAELLRQQQEQQAHQGSGGAIYDQTSGNYYQTPGDRAHFDEQSGSWLLNGGAMTDPTRVYSNGELIFQPRGTD